MRDWGYAGDYVKAMWLMHQQETAQEYVIGTEVSHSVRDFVNAVFNAIDIEVTWEGSDTSYHTETNELLVEVNPEFFRPAEVDLLRADTSKAKSILGWEPETSFEELVAMMVSNNISEAT